MRFSYLASGQQGHQADVPLLTLSLMSYLRRGGGLYIWSSWGSVSDSHHDITSSWFSRAARGKNKPLLKQCWWLIVHGKNDYTNGSNYEDTRSQGAGKGLFLNESNVKWIKSSSLCLDYFIISSNLVIFSSLMPETKLSFRSIFMYSYVKIW